MSRIVIALRSTLVDYKHVCKPIPQELRIALRTMWYGLRDIMVSLCTLVVIPLVWLLTTIFVLWFVFLRNLINAND